MMILIAVILVTLTSACSVVCVMWGTSAHQNDQHGLSYAEYVSCFSDFSRATRQVTGLLER